VPEIKIEIGEKDRKAEPFQIIIMTPNYFKTVQSSRNPKDKLNLTNVNLVVFDEADELFT
jgi:superfamily II DNA/RNA helicase